MNGLAFVISFSVVLFNTLSRTTTTVFGQENVRIPEKKTLNLQIDNVDFTQLPSVSVEISNAVCPDDSSSFYVALQLFGYDDADSFEYYGKIDCPTSNSAIALITVDPLLAYYPHDEEKVYYIDYAVVYAWLSKHSNQGYSDSPMQANVQVQYPSPFERKRQSVFEYGRKLSYQCDVETEVQWVIDFPAVFPSGIKAGVIVTMPDFITNDLKSDLEQTPRLSIIMTIFLDDYCLPIGSKSGFCSLFHSLHGDNDIEETPQLFLHHITNELILQVVDAFDQTAFFSYLSGIRLKPGLAHQILLSITDYQYRIAVASWSPKNESVLVDSQVVESYFDNRVRVVPLTFPSYLVIGGSDFFRAFSGFVDFAFLFRTRYAHENDVDVIQYRQLSMTGQKLALRLLLSKEMQKLESSSQRWPPIQSLQKHSQNCSEIYLKTIEKLETEGPFDGMKEALDLSSFLGCETAEFLLGVLSKWHIIHGNFYVHYLKASFEGSHFGDLAIGKWLLKNNYSRNLAFMYLKRAADVSQKATALHSSSDRWIDSIRLDNDEEMELHNKDNDDSPLIAWLLYQAGMGDAEAMHDVARLFYLGAQGVERDMQRAAHLFRQAALVDADPELLYDYAIVLLHGRGVEVNKSLAVKLLEKSAEKGYGPAYGALGWHYMEYEGGNLSKFHEKL